MSEITFAHVDVAAQWGRLNDSIIALVDVIPDDKLDWSPREELWNFRGILAHTAFVRHNWLGNIVKDGESVEDSDLFAAIQTKAGVQQMLRDSWARAGRFLSEQANVDEVEKNVREEITAREGEALGGIENMLNQYLAGFRAIGSFTLPGALGELTINLFDAHNPTGRSGIRYWSR